MQKYKIHIIITASVILTAAVITALIFAIKKIIPI